MAAIAFNTAQRAAERLEAVLTAVGEKFDVFVSYQMQQAAAEAEPARTPPDNELAGTATPFRPLDAGIVSDAIPAWGCVHAASSVIPTGHWFVPNT